MTQFAMALWLFSETGLASALALLFAAGAVGTLVAQSFAGLLVDRYSRKLVMITCDIGSTVTSFVLLYLAVSGTLQLWHLFFLVAMSSPLSTLQSIAYRATVATMLPKSSLGRGASLATLTHYGTNIVAPAFAAAIYPFYGLQGVIVADIVSFALAMMLIVTVNVPRVKPMKDRLVTTTANGSEASTGVSESDPEDRTWIDNMREGFSYIRKYPQLRALLVFQMAFMSFHEITNALWQPLLMARSDNDPVVVASVAMASGVTGVLASLWLSAYGGPRRPIRAYLFASLGAGTAKTLFGASSTALQWQATQAASSINFPIRASAYNMVWMAQVPHHRQGQVFGLTGLCVNVCMYLCFLGTALAADYVVQPWLDAHPGILGPLHHATGTGAGAAFALLYIVGGLGMACVSLVGLRSRLLRDHTELEETGSDSSVLVEGQSR
ncbi:MAG: MFS transporter [Halioglobus sp.]|nr:MFS transporter [Halioglobus sp.]